MTFTVTVNSWCASERHAHMTAHIDGRDIDLIITREEMLKDDPELDDLIGQRIKSFVLETHSDNWEATRGAIQAKTFKV